MPPTAQQLRMMERAHRSGKHRSRIRRECPLCLEELDPTEPWPFNWPPPHWWVDARINYLKESG